jgi:hypothetical protein
VVIVRTADTFRTAVHGGTLLVTGGYKIYTFNATSAFGWV